MKTLSHLLLAITLFAIAFTSSAQEAFFKRIQTNTPVLVKFDPNQFDDTDTVAIYWAIGTDRYYLWASFTNSGKTSMEITLKAKNKSENWSVKWNWSLALSAYKFSLDQSSLVEFVREVRGRYKKIGVVNGHQMYRLAEPAECLGRVLRDRSQLEDDDYIFKVGSLLSFVPCQNWVGAEPVTGQKLILASDGDWQQEMFFPIHVQSDGTTLASLDTVENIKRRKSELAEAKANAKLSPAETMAKAVESVRRLQEAVSSGGNLQKVPAPTGSKSE